MPSDLPGAPAGTPFVEARGLHKSFGDNHVLRGVDLEIAAGSVHALIGPSGSGKTTVLRSLNGLESPEAGTLRIGDLELDLARPRTRAERAALHRASAMVFQQHQLFPHLSVLGNVTIGPLRVQRRPRDEVMADALALLERVGLREKADAFPSSLSGGQQQRVGIVRALALQPSMLLFDEPTSSLDPELVGEVLAVMTELAREGWTMAVVTHELGFAREVADQVSFFADGVVVERGTPAQLFDAPQHERTQRFLQRMRGPFGA
ncbi:amino acid ABC transporter ATP-binding protein [Agrococcus carbonis]|uniref:Amino acid ABC transporter ATP-binding protein, PAAT family n=1 Tax=Agrococcus carbonis TaxID=684552 RepID=A0A1H1KZH5_9MICO|nr:amino acid ABC transporter ATP-binding protein [Agrococcus carbonis]SDR67683.1 amino acid ABC transporter ATP-binding protein, PAAT family [Agrococcus carbonis]